MTRRTPGRDGAAGSAQVALDDEADRRPPRLTAVATEVRRARTTAELPPIAAELTPSWCGRGGRAATAAAERSGRCGSTTRTQRDAGARERLILHYSPLVKYVAGRVGVGLPPNIEQADLVSYGIFGLIDAIEKFDLEREIKFETYAITRIRGAIIDELRAIDWIPRSVRSKAREVERAYAALEAEPAPHAHRAGDRRGDGHRRRGPAPDLQPGLVRQRGRPRRAAQRRRREGRQARASVDTLEDHRAEDPVAAFESEETKYLLAGAINTLPEREKIVVTLYYYEGLTLAEIGQVLGVTESRICQMHTKAVMQLRTRMGSISEDD